MYWPDGYTVQVHEEPDQDPWAEVTELPGCFATGCDMDELREAVAEAIDLYRSDTAA